MEEITHNISNTARDFNNARFLSFDDLRAYLRTNASDETIKNWIHKDQLPPVIRAPGTRLFVREEVDAYLLKQRR